MRHATKHPSRPHPAPSVSRPKPAFVGDRTVGGLVRWLRLLGFDAASVFDLESAGALTHPPEQTWLLTKIAAHAAGAGHGRLVHISADRPRSQVREVVRTLGLTTGEMAPFSRCARCNLLLKPVDRHCARQRVPEYVWQRQAAFSHCPRCRRVYWRGTHRAHLLAQIRDLMP
jgi:uncharacterized protein with PIN domain